MSTENYQIVHASQLADYLTGGERQTLAYTCVVVEGREKSFNELQDGETYRFRNLTGLPSCTYPNVPVYTTRS